MEPTASLALLCLLVCFTGSRAQIISEPILTVDFTLGSDKIMGTYVLVEDGESYSYSHELALVTGSVTCGAPSTIPGLSADALTTPLQTSIIAPVTVTFADLESPAYTAPSNPGETSNIKFCQIITARTSAGSVVTNVQTSIFTVTVTELGSFTVGVGSVATAANLVGLITNTGSITVLLSTIFLDSAGDELLDATQVLVAGQPLRMRIRTADGSNTGINVLSIDSMTATVTGVTPFAQPPGIVSTGAIEGTYWDSIVEAVCDIATGCDFTILLPVDDFFSEPKSVSFGGTAILQVGSDDRRLSEGVSKATFTASVTTLEADGSESSLAFDQACTRIAAAAVSAILLTFV